MKWGLLYAIAGIFMLSCTTRPVTPSKASRRAIDTLYQKQVLLLQPQIDSICAIIQDSIYVVAVDSILNERRTEMIELVK